MNLVCQICDKEMKSAHTLGRHIVKEHQLKGKEYYDQYLITNEREDKCFVCGKETKFISIIKGYSTKHMSCAVPKSMMIQYYGGGGEDCSDIVGKISWKDGR